MAKYRVYNSHTAQSVTVNSTNQKNAISAGRKKLTPNKKGIVRAYKLK